MSRIINLIPKNGYRFNGLPVDRAIRAVLTRDFTQGVAGSFLCFLIVIGGAGVASAQGSGSGLPEGRCKAENELLEAWRQRGILYFVAYKGPEGLMFVHPTPWRRISKHLQRRLVVAAYCPIRTNFERGRLDVSGRLGPSIGAVVDGVWRERELP